MTWSVLLPAPAHSPPDPAQPLASLHLQTLQQAGIWWGAALPTEPLSAWECRRDIYWGWGVISPVSPSHCTHHPSHHHTPSPRAGAAPILGDTPIMGTPPSPRPGSPRCWPLPGDDSRSPLSLSSPTARNSSIRPNPVPAWLRVPPTQHCAPHCSEGVSGTGWCGRGDHTVPFPTRLPASNAPDPLEPPATVARLWSEQWPPSWQPPACHERGETLPCACRGPRGWARGCWHRESHWTAWWGSEGGHRAPLPLQHQRGTRRRALASLR